MIEASGTIYIKVNFRDCFHCDEDSIEEYIEENIEDYLEDVEITDIDIDDVREISRDEAMADEIRDVMREMDWERGE